jgi:hypothetical protein
LFKLKRELGFSQQWPHLFITTGWYRVNQQISLENNKSNTSLSPVVKRKMQ